MYCPKCGCENQSDAKQCENCGFVFHIEEELKPQKIELPESVIINENIAEILAKKTEPKVRIEMRPYVPKEKILGVILFGIAAFVFVLSLVGAISIFYGGAEIAEIQSVGGKTLEEAYYYRIQSVYNGYGFLVLTLGIFCSAVLSALGFFFCWKQPVESGK